MWRDNTKSMTPSVKADTHSGRSVLKGRAEPGKRNNRVPKGAGSVMSENGKTPRPGYKQKKVPGGGYGSVARPGWHQKIKG